MEAGETVEQALGREVVEETGLVVEVGRYLGSVTWPGPGGVSYDIRDHECTVTGGALRAGDDASEVGWYDVEAMAALPLTSSLLETLRGWQLL